MPDTGLMGTYPSPAALTILGQAVHAAWRDTMLAQGREVAPKRLVWENLTEEDQKLDIRIGAEVARAALAAAQAGQG